MDPILVKEGESSMKSSQLKGVKECKGERAYYERRAKVIIERLAERRAQIVLLRRVVNYMVCPKPRQCMRRSMPDIVKEVVRHEAQPPAIRV